MPEIPFNVIAFDLDGTLADTAPDLSAALNHALSRLGRRQIPIEAVRHLVGHGAKALLRKGLSVTGAATEELVKEGFPHFIDHYSANICNGTSIYRGLEQVLDGLRDIGIATAICTNKNEQLTHLLLKALGWESRFDVVMCGDTLPVRKPDPAPLLEAVARVGGGRAAFVGDSITDADTARAARVPFIAVSFGFSDRPVEELGADAIIHDYDELIPTLKRL